ncbi:HPr family phosphocarrier protein [Thioalbus denitrificans]|uniref:Phosphocarrier protein n=1 Tax=Thioalbus denitrificans TaxID=547122 RepID=A0A369CC17_9GAMM|nr:HPr family phosphocarrier protein [Thioalbus denitrificans]RCX31091.1 phosphocarrier protein [Thioalbus denitrificans]
MPTLQTTIINKLGLHARAAAKFVKTASAFESSVTLRRGEREVNGKSILGVMMLAASRGTEVEIDAEGPDADAALEALRTLIDERFGEAE